MPTPPLSQEALQEAIDIWEACGRSVAKAVEMSGLPRGTYRSRLEKAKKLGMHLDPAVKDSMAAVGTGMVPALVWAKTKNPDGTSYSTLLKPEKDGVEDIADRIRAALEGLAPAPAVPAPQHADDSLLTLYPIADAHLGMMAWGAETGEAYDTRIGADRLVSWIGQAVASSPQSETAIILDVGDLNHADDQTNMTPRSKHVLDVDTRHFRTLEMTIAALGTSIELAKAKHKTVIVRILPGNHNPTSYIAIMFALVERYRNDPRVEVQKVPGEFFAHEFGQCLIAAHHGDKAKAERMVMYLADEYAALWGRTKHRFLWTGHLHNHKSQDIGGVQWEQLRAITARDAYASSHAYVARSQLQAITYHRDLGEVQRVKIAGP